MYSRKNVQSINPIVQTSELKHTLNLPTLNLNGGNRMRTLAINYYATKPKF